MYHNEQFLRRVAAERIQELTRQAEQARSLPGPFAGARKRVARALISVAATLEPIAVEERRQLRW